MQNFCFVRRWRARGSHGEFKKKRMRRRTRVAKEGKKKKANTAVVKSSGSVLEAPGRGGASFRPHWCFVATFTPLMKNTDLIFQKLLLSRDLCMCYDSGPDACYHHIRHKPRLPPILHCEQWCLICILTFQSNLDKKKKTTTIEKHNAGPLGSWRSLRAVWQKKKHYEKSDFEERKKKVVSAFLSWAVNISTRQ